MDKLILPVLCNIFDRLSVDDFDSVRLSCKHFANAGKNVYITPRQAQFHRAVKHFSTNEIISLFMKPDTLDIIQIITEIDIKCIGFNSIHIDKIITHMSKLFKLNLMWNNLGDAGAAIIARSTTITSVNLMHNNIGDIGATALAESKTLKEVNLSYNNISAIGATALAERSVLNSINISSNMIGNVGASSLARLRSIRCLNVSSCLVGDIGAIKLAQSKTLKEIIIINQYNALQEANIDIRMRRISDKGAIALAANTSLGVA